MWPLRSIWLQGIYLSRSSFPPFHYYYGPGYVWCTSRSISAGSTYYSLNLILGDGNNFHTGHHKARSVHSSHTHKDANHTLVLSTGAVVRQGKITRYRLLGSTITYICDLIATSSSAILSWISGSIIRNRHASHWSRPLAACKNICIILVTEAWLNFGSELKNADGGKMETPCPQDLNVPFFLSSTCFLSRIIARNYSCPSLPPNNDVSFQAPTFAS